MKKLLLIMLTFASSALTLAQSNHERAVLKLNKDYEEAIARRDALVHECLFAEAQRPYEGSSR